MRIETQNGRKIVCGHIFKIDKIKVGQIWQGVGGFTVTITKIENNHIYYQWEEENGIVKTHNKESFAFQCRYCLVVDETWIKYVKGKE